MSDSEQQRGVVKFYERRIVIISFIIVFMSAGIIFYLIKNFDWDAIYLVILFLIGPLLQLFVLFNSKKTNENKRLQFYFCTLSFFWLVLLGVVLGCYSIIEGKGIVLSISIFSLLMTGFICATVFYFYKKMIGNDQNESDFDHLITSRLVREKPFLNTIYFFGSFLCVCNFLTLSIALFDNYSNGKALFAEKHSDNSTQNEIVKLAEGQGKIFFDESSALTKTKYTSTKDIEEIKKRGLTDSTNLYEYNYRSIVNTLDSIYQFNKIQLSAKIRVKLVGHSNDTRIGQSKSRYNSNYELSQARVQQVHLLLIDSLAHREKSPDKKNSKVFYNLEWLLVPLSNENKFIDPQPLDDTQKRCVDITFQRLDQYPINYSENEEMNRKKMTLLDYMYFMIYTITTTGYGDIKPVDGYIKFVVSLANIYEVFFTVIFFSAVLSAPLSNLFNRLRRQT